jgi:hypothetical protein
MRRSTNFYLMQALFVTLASTFGASDVFSQYVPGGTKLRGAVKTLEGKSLEGVTVSIRGEGKTFVTTVFTNQQGVYVFPSLEKGIKYNLMGSGPGISDGPADC